MALRPTSQPYTKAELEQVQRLLDTPGIHSVAESLRILLKPIVNELLEHAVELKRKPG